LLQQVVDLGLGVQLHGETSFAAGTGRPIVVPVEKRGF